MRSEIEAVRVGRVDKQVLWRQGDGDVRLRHVVGDVTFVRAFREQRLDEFTTTRERAAKQDLAPAAIGGRGLRRSDCFA